MKRSLRRVIFILLSAAFVAAALVLGRSPDPAYRAREWLACGRYSAFDALISEVAQTEGVDACVIKAIVWKESAFDAKKIGPTGARGLMQLGAERGREWALTHRIETWMISDLFNAHTNLRVGCWYLRGLLDKWNRRDAPLVFALAEYRAGPVAVKRWSGERGGASELLRAIDRADVRDFVEIVWRRAQLYRAEPR